MLCVGLMQARDKHILQTNVEPVFIVILVPQNALVTPDVVTGAIETLVH